MAGRLFEKPVLQPIEYLPSIETIVAFRESEFSMSNNPLKYAASLYLLEFLLSREDTRKCVYETLAEALTHPNASILGIFRKHGLDLTRLNRAFTRFYTGK